MNLYYYWFYSVYSIYYAFSKDFHFDILAVGLFSVIVSLFGFSIATLICLMLGIQESLFKNPIPIIIGAVLIQIINSFLFLPKKRQRKLMSDYKENGLTDKRYCSSTFNFYEFHKLCISNCTEFKN